MAGAFIFGCAGPVLTDAEARFFRAAEPWGFMLFDRNLKSKAQVRVLTATLRETVGRDAPILIDQEGGRVQRLWPPVWDSHPPALDIATRARDPERAMYLRGRLIAAELRDIGIDTNCAPLADIAGDITHPRLRNRCYGFEAEPVARLARALSAGQTAGGVHSVLKHVPGHGQASKDSHVDLPVVSTTKDELTRRDFAAFHALADLPLAMSAHVVFRALDPERPATTSPIVNRVIREEIGFGGLLMTDDLSMDALSGSMTQRSTDALSAGCDLILHCNGEMAEMEQVASAAGLLRPDAQKKADALKRPEPDDVDLSALRADLLALTKECA